MMLEIKPVLTDSLHKVRSTCRGCESTDLVLFLSLGQMPLANAFLRSPEEFVGEPAYPLDVYFCTNCSLVQLRDTISPDALFRNYIYVSGTSETMAAHNSAHAAAMTGHLALGREDLVVEIASNDGSLLSCYRDRGTRVLGIEPAQNLAAISRSRGIETLDQFFDEDLAPLVRKSYGPARLLVANNVLAHVDETAGFLRGCRELLDMNGLLVVEVPYVGELLANMEYDTIYHEHLCYFSISALLQAYASAGLSIVRIDRVPVHGGSLRVHAARRDAQPNHAPEVLAEASQEHAAGLAGVSGYERFAAGVAENRRSLRALLEHLRNQGLSVAAYGAPAKGNTLLNYCNIDTSLVAFTVDKNPMKVGLYTPGMHLPVLPTSALLERRPDYVLILAWNFAEEIMRQQQAYRDAGGRFIIPIPEPRMV